MFRKLSCIIILLICGSTVAETGVRYSLLSVKGDRALVSVEVSPEAITGDGRYFGVVTTDDDVRCNGVVMRSDVEKRPVTWEEQGWMGGTYLRWFSFDAMLFPQADTVRHGELVLQFDRPLPFGAGKTAGEKTFGSIVRLSAGTSRAVPSVAKKRSAGNTGPPFIHGLRIAVAKDGIYELTPDFLNRHGVPIDRIDARTFRLFCADSEVPILIPEGHHRKLSGDDRILFFGTSLRTPDGNIPDFSGTNCYWLTWGDGIGLRVPFISGARRKDPTLFGGAEVVLAESYIDTLHCELDETLIWLGSVEGVPPSELTDNPDGQGDVAMWYWGIVGLRDLTSFSFTCPSPVRRATARIRVGLMGMSSIDSITPDHDVTFFLNDKPAGINNRHTWDGQRYTIFESDTFSTDLLEDGANKLTIQTRSSRSTDRCALDWIEIIYTRGYGAVDAVARFRSLPSTKAALTEYSVEGFGTQDIDLWDITRNRCFTGMPVEKGSGDYRGTWRLSFQDSTVYPVHYYAQTREKRITAPEAVLDTVPLQWDTLCDYEYLAVSADSFATDLAPLLAMHRRNGLKATFVSVDNIYNRFTAGIRDPEALRLFLRYLRNAGHLPRYLLLGGDCTHDLYKKNADRTIVPTHLSRIPGWGPGADDGWFSLVNEGDLFPDCAIGRFPARNRNDMRALVEKTVRYIEEPDMSYWRDHLLLLGGGGSEFSAFNSKAQDEVIRSRFRIRRLDADPASQWYREGSAAKRAIADYCNTGMYIINFNGHGGGNIWSDNDFFGYDDLSMLHNGQWRGGRLPIVFSFTCLTGFFESTEYRSLGEEFVRCEKDGAIAFYGSSAYTSQNGNMIMNRMFLEEVLSGAHATIGELIDFCEMEMLVRYRAQYLPLVRQYNLLGDPALPLAVVPDTMRIATEFDTASRELTIAGRCSPVDSGTIRISLVQGTEVLEQVVEPLKSDTFSTTFKMKAGAPPLVASVRGYAWNDALAVRGAGLFSRDTLTIDNVQIEPPVPHFGDSITVSCNPITAASGDSGVQVYCMYAVTAGDPARAQFSGVTMIRGDNGSWKSVNPLVPVSDGSVDEELILYFRQSAPSGTAQSGYYTFEIQGKPDCVISERRLPVYWDGDSLAVSFTVQNIGTAPASGVEAVLCFRKDGTAKDDTVAILRTEDTLKQGDSYRFKVVLSDTSGFLSYYVMVDPRGKITELLEDNNRLDGSCMIWRKKMKRPGDTLLIDSGRTVVAPVDSFKSSRRIFILEDSCGSAVPLATPSVWRVRRNGNPVRWFFASRPSLTGSDSLVWKGTYDARIADSALVKRAYMQFDTLIGQWRCAQPGAVQSKKGVFSMTTQENGWYAPAFFSDAAPPELMVSIHGKVLDDIDYAAKDRPFTVLLSDPSSVVPQSVGLYLNGKKLAEDERSALPSGGDLRSITVSAYPEAEHRVDSLEVQCSDFAGNLAKRTFAYIPGADLSIRSFTCHPNPFTARRNGDGSISQIRFAFLLTDVASSVSLSIFTVSGKKIWTWSGGDLIGYQQVAWNGRDRDGYRIANGTYYAKLFVKNDRRKAVKIIRIAKLEGF